jgi:hypothetical protein
MLLPLSGHKLTRAGWNQGGNTNLNFPQPYYQVHTYGPGTQPIPDSFFPKPPMMSSATREVCPGMSENMREQVARTLREFGLELKGRARTYQKPYSEFFDTIPYPKGV